MDRDSKSDLEAQRLQAERILSWTVQPDMMKIF